MKNSHRTGVSTFAIRTNQRTDQKLQKSLHLFHLGNNFKNFSLSLLKDKKRNAQPDTDKNK
jgi:hypothetical protein